MNFSIFMYHFTDSTHFLPGHMPSSFGGMPPPPLPPSTSTSQIPVPPSSDAPPPPPKSTDQPPLPPPPPMGTYAQKQFVTVAYGLLEYFTISDEID